MVSKRQVAEQGDFISDGYPAETCDIRNLLGNGRPKNEREEMPHGHSLIKYGKTKDGAQRYYCKTCKKAFAISEDSIFGGTKVSVKK